MSVNLQGRVSFSFSVADIGSQRAKGIDQQADRALLHAGTAGKQPLAGARAEVGGEEAHGGAGGMDIDDGYPGLGTQGAVLLLFQGANHHGGVVAIAQVLGALMASAQGMEDEGTVADAF